MKMQTFEDARSYCILISHHYFSKKGTLMKTLNNSDYECKETKNKSENVQILT